MTALEAIKSSVNYPLTDANAQTFLIGRGVDPSGEYSAEMAQSKDYRLAYADTLRFLVTMVNLSQGGSVTQAAADLYARTANAIYREYGEALVGADARPRVKNISKLF